MKINSKSRYAVMALADIASFDRNKPVSLRDISLRQNISLVSQETTLFDDSILNNIKYSRENASNEEIYEVARLSNCEEFVDKLPNKYDTIIGENGIRLSGGEKQRISIARAMLKKSSIILEFNH